MSIRVLAYSSILWKNKEQADAFKSELDRWLVELRRGVGNFNAFLVSGTLSDPALCPIPVYVVNANVPETKPHSFGKWDYALCAGQAGFWYAFFRTDWDVVLYTDTTVLINCDLRSHIEKFWGMPDKWIMAGEWFGRIDDGFSVWKREAIIKYLHERKRADLDDSIFMLSENEKTAVLSDFWFNPWPQFPSTRCDWPVNQYTEAQENEMLQWPVITKPTPRLIELHRKRYEDKN